MSIRSYLQDHPAFMVWSWQLVEKILLWMKPLFARVGLERSSAIVKPPEMVIKKLLFDCQECGQCVLHYTGMTCPMTCPKNLRNGPCGGVRLNGHSEVKPEMPCVWVQAYERSLKMPLYGSELILIQPPVDRRLEGTSAWINMLTGADRKAPEGWQ